MKYFFLLFLIFSSFGQESLSQEASSNNDLRASRSIFFIKEFSKNTNLAEYKLLSSVSGQFNFEILNKGEIISTKKVDTESAHNLDELFVDQFISFKYLMKNSPQKKCQKKFYLNLRGEDQIICDSENDKIKKIENFIAQLKKKFL